MEFKVIHLHNYDPETNSWTLKIEKDGKIFVHQIYADIMSSTIMKLNKMYNIQIICYR